jgi:hypothetical protein
MGTETSFPTEPFLKGMVMEPKELAALYKAYCNGDSITDAQLHYGIPCLIKHVEFLHNLGERFHFSWRAMYDFLQALEGFRDSRSALFPK